MPIGGLKEIDDRIADCQDLPTLVLKNLRKFADATFLVDGLADIKRSFKEVHDAAIVYALALREMGVRNGTYVAIFSEASIDAFVFEIAVWLAGGCACPLSHQLLPGEISQVLDISSADIVYCASKHITTLEKIVSSSKKPFKVITDRKHEKYVSLEVVWQDRNISEEELSQFSTIPTDPLEHIVYLLFTSGTTGIPKGVKLSSYASLLNGCRIYEGAACSILVTSPIYWISSPAAFVNALLDGNQFIFPGVRYLPNTNQADPYHLLECIHKYKPQKWMTCASVVLDLCYLEGVEKYDVSSLTHLSVGGTVVTSSQKKFMCDVLFKGRNIVQERFGTTEAGFFTRQWLNSPPNFDDAKSASFGPPSPGVEVKIIDADTGNELGPNEVGEFVVRSDAMMQGYINEGMSKTYTKDDWYHLGDLGYYDEDGWMYFKSRIKELIKYRGYQIVPMELEKVIYLHPDVLEACVVGKPHPVECELPTAFVVKKKNSSLTESALMSFVAERVNDAKKLRGGVIFKSSLPRSAVGKVLSRKLIEELACDS